MGFPCWWASLNCALAGGTQAAKLKTNTRCATGGRWQVAGLFVFTKINDGFRLRGKKGLSSVLCVPHSPLATQRRLAHCLEIDAAIAAWADVNSLNRSGYQSTKSCASSGSSSRLNNIGSPGCLPFRGCTNSHGGRLFLRPGPHGEETSKTGRAGSSLPRRSRSKCRSRP
jgi:hypothetical protein